MLFFCLASCLEGDFLAFLCLASYIFPIIFSFLIPLCLQQHPLRVHSNNNNNKQQQIIISAPRYAIRTSQRVPGAPIYQLSGGGVIVFFVPCFLPGTFFSHFLLPHACMFTVYFSCSFVCAAVTTCVYMYSPWYQRYAIRVIRHKGYAYALIYSYTYVLNR